MELLLMIMIGLLLLNTILLFTLNSEIIDLKAMSDTQRKMIKNLQENLEPPVEHVTLDELKKRFPERFE